MRAAYEVLAALFVLAAASPAVAQVYTWTDRDGSVHYTADPWAVPPQYRTEDLPPRPPAPVVTRLEPSPAPRPTGGTVVEFDPGEPIVVTARLNGVPLTLILDTGADRTLLTPAAVARAGYEPLIVPGGSSVRILGVTGAAMAPQVTVPFLDVAGASVGPISLIVHDAGLGPLDGLLGRDVLDAFTLTIDSAAGRATLIPR